MKTFFLLEIFIFPKCIANFILNELKLKSTASSHDLSSIYRGPGQCHKEGNSTIVNLELQHLTREFLGLLLKLIELNNEVTINNNLEKATKSHTP